MIDYFMERSIATDGFDPDVLWTPFVAEDGRVGYRVQKEGSTDVRFFMLVPSESGTGKPDVFIYEGPSDEPSECDPMHYYCAFIADPPSR